MRGDRNFTILLRSSTARASVEYHDAFAKTDAVCAIQAAEQRKHQEPVEHLSEANGRRKAFTSKNSTTIRMDAVVSIRQFFEKENNRHSGETVGKLISALTSPVVALASVETLQEMCRLMSSSHENR